jgi:hypothetical protein
MRKISTSLPCLERSHPAWDQFLPKWAITFGMLDAVVIKYVIECAKLKTTFMFEIHNSKWLAQGRRELTSTEISEETVSFGLRGLTFALCLAKKELSFEFSPLWRVALIM